MFSKFFLCTALIVTICFSLEAQAAESLEQTIGYLINYVAHSDATFIRNGEPHTGAEASAHVKAKYEHFRNQIKTPEDFIRLSASRSLLSGKPYLVRTKAGKETRLDEWLTEVLKQHRQGGAL